MKNILFTIIFLLSTTVLPAQTICNPAGNVVLFSNYDGGVLNINVDVNIPNLKIGVVSYEPVTINLGGTFVNNVTAVRFAGYTPSGNIHCNNSPSVTSINGAPPGTDTIVYTPNSPVSNPNGNNLIICNYSCDTVTSQGGCNTPDQIAAYFLQSFGGLLRSHLTQYGCWTGAYTISNGGNCCVGAVSTVPPPSCAFVSSDTSFCEKLCIDFTDLSSNTPTSWQWYFDGALPDTSTLQNPANICYNVYGTYDVKLVACNTGGCDSILLPGFIEVFPPTPIPSITQSNDTLFCTPAYAYAWYDAVNPAAVLSTDSFFVALQTGSFFVVVTDSNGCQASSTVYVVTGIAASAGTFQSFSVTPNPATGWVTFIINEISEGEAFVMLYDLQGILIETIPVNSGLVSYDASKLPAGMYRVKFENNGKLYLSGFIKN